MASSSFIFPLSCMSHMQQDRFSFWLKLETERPSTTHFPFRGAPWKPQRKVLWLLLWAKFRPFLSQSSCFLWFRALYHPWFLFFSWVLVHQVSEVGWCCMSTWFSFKQESPGPGLLYFCIFLKMDQYPSLYNIITGKQKFPIINEVRIHSRKMPD